MAAKAGKNIVICSDGTGNTAVKGRGTNVFKIYEAVDLQGHKRKPSLRPQVAIYDDGVGTEKIKYLRMLGGAFGLGLTRNVKQLYTQLARVYKREDSIYLFGFSRGAFTVRTLAGLISECGIPNVEEEKLAGCVALAYRAYRKKYKAVMRPLWEFFGGTMRLLRGKPVRTPSTEEWREKYAHDKKKKPPIQFIGVWDTVDAVGFPVDFIADLANKFVYRFKFEDTTLGDNVAQACHAISIDDERKTFHPVMWNASPNVEQVWFAGVHSNVGGGYPKQGMSLVALDWMASRARACGLRLLPRAARTFHESQNENDNLYDSRAGLAAYYRYKPREIGGHYAKPGIKPMIHLSVFERIVEGPQGYSPGNLCKDLQVVATEKVPETVLEKLATAVKNGHDEGRTTFLDEVRPWIRIRHWAHWGLFAATIAFLFVGAYANQTEAGWNGWAKAAGKVTTLEGVWATITSTIFGLLFLSALVVAYLTGLLARWRMETAFARSWKAIRPVLRDILDPRNRAEQERGRRPALEQEKILPPEFELHDDEEPRATP